MSSSLSDPLLHIENGAIDRTKKGSQDLEDGSPYEHVSNQGDLTSRKNLEDDELPPELCSVNQGTSSFWAATTNTVALLLGMGMLSMGYAVEQGGVFSLSLLLLFALIMCYTGYLLGKCLATNPAIITYQDIGAAAFGIEGRAVLTTCLYMEVCATLVGYTISVGDNLGQLFPNAGLSLSWIQLEPSQLLVMVAMLVVLPTVCVRDLSYVSCFSFVGFFSSLIVMGAVAWTGLFEGVGFFQSVPLFQITKIPLVAGLYAYCYSGHVVIPSIYTSMKDPRQFPKVIVVSFIMATGIYGGLGLMGAFMFGDKTLDQISLNIPTHLAVGTVALWTTVATPVCKFSLNIAPVAKELESLLPFPENSMIHFACGCLIRITFLLSIMTLAIALPFFGYMVSFIGSALSISLSIIFPCSLYLKMFWSSATRVEVQLNVAFILIGFIFAVVGTQSSLRSLIESLKE